MLVFCQVGRPCLACVSSFAGRGCSIRPPEEDLCLCLSLTAHTDPSCLPSPVWPHVPCLTLRSSSRCREQLFPTLTFSFWQLNDQHVLKPPSWTGINEQRRYTFSFSRFLKSFLIFIVQICSSLRIGLMLGQQNIWSRSRNVRILSFLCRWKMKCMKNDLPWLKNEEINYQYHTCPAALFLP